MEKDPMKHIPAKSLIDLPGCSHHGFVVKEGGRLRTMVTRYFVLYEGCLYYYKDFNSAKEQGSLCLASYEVKADLQDDEVFGIKLEAIQKGKKSYFFVVSTKKDREIWIEKMTQEMKRIAGDGSEEYDYCYERHNNQQLEEPQHDYEPTDEIDTMQSPRGTTAYTRPPDATSRREPVSLPMPNIPPPALPARTGASLPRFGNSTDQFVPPRPLPKGNAKPIVPPPQVRGPLPNAPPKRLAPQPMGQPYTGHTGRARGKDMPPKPDPSTKPLVGKNPSIMTAADCAESRSSIDELKNRVRKRRENYVVQEIRSKEDSSSDSDDSEEYLDLEGESSEPMKRRGKPVGSSIKINSEKPRIPSDQNDLISKFLPLSVYQDSLTRQTAETLLNGIMKTGMYLLRTGRTGLRVITVYTEEGCKHYQIFENSGSYFLQDGEPQFETLEHLVSHYYKNNLPKCSFRLQTPFS